MDREFVVVGLGNPGKQYALTRHNMGYLTVKTMADFYGWKLKQETRFRAFVAKEKLDLATFHLLLPTTYMNESGLAVRRYLDFYKLGPENLFVVCDDIALPFGFLRVKGQGSSGGHNGLKSVEVHMGTRNYARLRMGIGQSSRKDLADYVLDKFSFKEAEQLEDFIKLGIGVIKCLPELSMAELMTRVNQKVGDVNE